MERRFTLLSLANIEKSPFRHSSKMREITSVVDFSSPIPLRGKGTSVEAIFPRILDLPRLLMVLLLVFCPVVPTRLVAQQQSEVRPTNQVVVELFSRGDSDNCNKAKDFLEQLQKRPGIEIKIHDVIQDQQQLKRLWQLSKRFGFENAKVPTFYSCDQLKVGFDTAENSEAFFSELLTIKAYVRPGCKHCQAARQFLNEMVLSWPALSVQYFDVDSDLNARAESRRLAEKFNVQIPSFPVIQVAGRLVVGFQTAEITGRNIEALFQDRSVVVPAGDPPAPAGTNSKSAMSGSESAMPVTNRPAFFLGQLATVLPLGYSALHLNFQSFACCLWPGQLQTDRAPPPQDPPESQKNQQELQPQKQGADANADAIPLPDEWNLPQDVPLPGEADQPGDTGDLILAGDSSDEIEVPWFGRLSVSQLGLPIFTLLIGLIDGFNPCAMWVLVFLLSVLVNIKERTKILAVAGTFVVVSGLAYFCFMTAWFNVFQMIGWLRPVQIGLGVVGIIVGMINVKDFLAFHKGVTLSIPESAKPLIYRRVRGIVSANQLSVAIAGAIVLAVVVNIVELLCTAGLPAMYTQVLSMQNLSAVANYGYLALYIVAYMFDDTLLVLIVVTTLSHRRLQEGEGRWLKLLSGVVILLLGVVMIFWPDALV